MPIRVRACKNRAFLLNFVELRALRKGKAVVVSDLWRLRAANALCRGFLEEYSLVVDWVKGLVFRHVVVGRAGGCVPLYFSCELP